MKILRTLLAACTLGLALAACGDSSPALIAPDTVRLDGGYTLGSGHRSDSTTTTTSSTTTESDTTSTERGGHTLGSGS